MRRYRTLSQGFATWVEYYDAPITIGHRLRSSNRDCELQADAGYQRRRVPRVLRASGYQSHSPCSRRHTDRRAYIQKVSGVLK